MRQCFSLAVALFLLVAPLTASAAPLTTPPAAPPTWDTTTAYIIFEKTPEGITPLSYQTIQLASPLKSLDTTAYLNDLAQKSADRSLLAVSLTTTEGDLVYQNTVTLPAILRGEFHGKDGGEIDGYQFPLEDVTFPVRVPYIPKTTLTLKDASLTRLASFELDTLAKSAPSPDAGIQYTVTPVSYTGSPANRVDMVILGDGYTAAQEATFNTHVATVVSNFFGIPPLQAYQNYYNIYSVFAASTQSGADYPIYNASCVYGSFTCCSDITMQSDPRNGQMKDTFYDCAYCYANVVHRLLYPKNSTAVYTAAAQVPDYDVILLIVNDTTYGGGGGDFAVFSMHTAAVQVAQHEYGHSFAALADEYEYSPPSYTCDDTNGSTYDDCPVNVTNQTTRALIKWAPWIQGTTPIPTPETGAWVGFVGLFQGAYYNPLIYYRSGDWCIMRALGYPFCQVPSQAYVLRLYRGGWGAPAEGISLIEPGTTSPAPTGIRLFYPATQTFQATILSPTVISPTVISWWVNGVEQVGATSSSFIYTSSLSQLGTVTIKLRANDASLYVHPSMAGTDLITEYTWTINVAYPIYMPVMTSP